MHTHSGGGIGTMALVYNKTSDSLPSPPSPSLTNPDMILPYDPRLRDSSSTQQSGPDITSLNDQMAMSLSATRAINRDSWGPGDAGGANGSAVNSGSDNTDGKHRRQQSMPGEWNDNDVPAHGSEGASAASLTPTRATVSQSRKTPQDNAAAGSGNIFKSGTSFLNLSRFSTVSNLSAGKSDASNVAAPPAQEEDEEEVMARADFARAEEILANAKRRLTTMESNLTRARSLNASRSTSVASTVREGHGSATHGQGRQNGWAVTAAKLRSAQWAQNGQNSNHTRVFSENSLPNPNGAPSEQTYDGERVPVRSSSAMGSFYGEDYNSSAHFYSHRPGFGGLEPLKEDELLSPSSDSSRAHSRGLDRLQDLTAKARSNVQLRDLREQMQDLKGKLDSLKLRTREDSLRRRSMQHLKSPSPFTDAEAWRDTPPRNGSRQSTRQSEDTARASDTSEPRKPASAVTSSSVPQIKAVAPIFDDEPLGSPGSMTGGPRGVIEGALSSLDEKLAGSPHASPQTRPVMHRPNLSGSIRMPVSVVEKSAFDPWSPQSEKAEIFGSVDIDAKLQTETAGKNEPEGSEEAEGTSREDSEGQKTASTPNTELSGDAAEAAAAASEAEMSHEDRPDAFDYENFVISSTMGTYSRANPRSRSSTASASTIGPDAYLDSEHDLNGMPSSHPDRYLYHTRQLSASSTSSLDTFATAHSRAASRLQAGSRQASSRQALRQAASREALGSMPGAFNYESSLTRVMTPVLSAPFAPSSSPKRHADSDSDNGDDDGDPNTPNGNKTPTVRPRTRTTSTGATSDITERPLSVASMSSFSRPRPPSTLLFNGSTATHSIVSSTASVFSTSTAAPAIDPATDPAAMAVRNQILRLLLTNPLNPSERASLSEADEARIAGVVKGLQRQCGALVWSGALHGLNGGKVGLKSVRDKLERAGQIMGPESWPHEAGERSGESSGLQEVDGDAEGEGSSVDGEGENERFVAL